MERRSWTKAVVGLVIVACLFSATRLIAQMAPARTQEQILPPLDASLMENQPTEMPYETVPTTASGYSAGAQHTATFQIDKDTGSLIVLADDQTNEYIQKIIQSLDKPVPQVLIKVLFLEVTHTNDLDIGVEGTGYLGGNPKAAQYTPYLTDSTGKLVQNPTLIGPATPATDLMGNPMAPGQIDWRDTLKSAFGVAAAAASASSGGGSYHIITKDLDMTLRALATVGKLNVLSRPSILARNNEQAYINIGESVPYVTTIQYRTGQAEPINTVSYRDTGITLQVTPHITPQGLVEMLIDGNTGISSTDWSRPLRITGDVFAYPITERLVNTSVIVPNGMTVVIGGLMTDQLVNTVSKIPILGDIPWLGTAFRRTTTEKTKTELIIFLTPTVVEKTPSLKDLSIAETKHVELASTAFDEKALNKNLDDWQTLLPRPKPTPPPGGFWRRTMGEIASAFSIFR